MDIFFHRGRAGMPVDSGTTPFPGRNIGAFESGTIPARGSAVGPKG